VRSNVHGLGVEVEKEEEQERRSVFHADDEGEAESVPVSDAEIVAVSTDSELLLSAQLSCCVCSFGIPCLSGANDGSCPPSCESPPCETSSPPPCDAPSPLSKVHLVPCPMLYLHPLVAAAAMVDWGHS
jgi:hypothetical protein